MSDPIDPTSVTSPNQEDGQWRTAAVATPCAGCGQVITAGQRMRLGGAEHGWVCQPCGNGIVIPSAPQRPVRAHAAEKIGQQCDSGHGPGLLRRVWSAVRGGAAR